MSVVKSTIPCPNCGKEIASEAFGSADKPPEAIFANCDDCNKDWTIMWEDIRPPTAEAPK